MCVAEFAKLVREKLAVAVQCSAVLLQQGFRFSGNLKKCPSFPTFKKKNPSLELYKPS